jgi:membrane protease subunit (stomatin/prohibitin family)
VYTISDIKKALVDTYDLMSTVTDRAQAGVIQAIIGKDIHELVQQHQHINNEIAKKVRADLKKFGVEVETAFMSSYHLSNTHLIIGSASVLPVDTETEEAEE